MTTRPRWTALGLGLLCLACSGGGEPAARSTPPTAAPETASSAPGPALSVARVDEAAEETPVRFDRVAPDRARTRLRNGTPWAVAADVLAALGGTGRVTVTGGRAVLDGTDSGARAETIDGEPWVEIAPFARRLGAYADVQEADGSVTLWPRETLLYWRDHGDPASPVLRAATRDGLLKGS